VVAVLVAAAALTYPMFDGHFGVRLFVDKVFDVRADSRQTFMAEFGRLRADVFPSQPKRTW
jgi:hypothetical protein